MCDSLADVLKAKRTPKSLEGALDLAQVVVKGAVLDKRDALMNFFFDGKFPDLARLA